MEAARPEARPEARPKPRPFVPEPLNTPATDALLESFKLTKGEVPYLAHISGLSCESVGNQAKRKNRLSADLVRTKLRTLPRDEAERLAWEWLFGEKR